MNKFCRILIPLLSIVIAVGFPSVADACPNCKNALEVARAIAFGASVLLLMSMPFAIGAIWGVALLRCGSNQTANQSSRQSLASRKQAE